MVKRPEFQSHHSLASDTEGENICFVSTHTDMPRTDEILSYAIWDSHNNKKNWNMFRILPCGNESVMEKKVRKNIAER
jgi:hypothetical protein